MKATEKKRFAEDLGIKIKSAREAIGMTQQELAKKLGSYQTHVSALERGTPPKIPSASRLRKIAEALNVTTDYLVGMERG